MRAQVAALFSIKPSLSLGALLQLEPMGRRETPSELRERRRLSEKIAMAYIGMFVTLGGGFSAKSTSSEKARQVSEKQHDGYDLALEKRSIDAAAVQPHVVLDFAQRLVDNRHTHFEHDPLFADDATVDATSDMSSQVESTFEDEEEERSWDWCPSGLPEPSWANAAIHHKHGRTVEKRLWHLAAEAVQLVRKLPPDTQELMAGNYVEESAWLILSMARPEQGRHGAVRRLLYLLSECL
eukprot:COSAG02_NODE_4906_length_4847_cov_7.816133_7_plen_239_part_00